MGIGKCLNVRAMSAFIFIAFVLRSSPGILRFARRVYSTTDRITPHPNLTHFVDTETHFSNSFTTATWFSYFNLFVMRPATVPVVYLYMSAPLFEYRPNGVPPVYYICRTGVLTFAQFFYLESVMSTSSLSNIMGNNRQMKTLAIT